MAERTKKRLTAFLNNGNVDFRYTPLSIHINYHPEKPDRMKDVHRFYYEKYDTPEKGIWRWNGGEGTKLLTECKVA